MKLIIEDMGLGFLTTSMKFDEILFNNIKNNNYEQREDKCHVPILHTFVVVPMYIVEIIKRIPTYEEFEFLAPSIVKICQTTNKGE